MGDQQRLFSFDEDPWLSNPNDVWLGSTVALRRNLSRYLFPNRCDIGVRKQLVELIGNHLVNGGSFQEPVLYSAESLSPEEKEFLYEHFLLRESIHQAHSGEGLLLEKTGRFLGIINLRDHLILSCADATHALGSAWEQLIAVESALSERLSFAFSSRFGFLTADPHLCGTGLIARSYLQLPALIATGQLAPLLGELCEETPLLQVSGLDGGKSPYLGDIVVVENSTTIGVTEEQIIAAVVRFSSRFEQEERTARRALRDISRGEDKDRVSRAYAIAVQAYQIRTPELLNALSQLKLGWSCDWLVGATPELLNRLFFSCRRGHLFAEKTVTESSTGELLHRRAEYLHKALQET